MLSSQSLLWGLSLLFLLPLSLICSRTSFLHLSSIPMWFLPQLGTLWLILPSPHLWNLQYPWACAWWLSNWTSFSLTVIHDLWGTLIHFWVEVWLPSLGLIYMKGVMLQSFFLIIPLSWLYNLFAYFLGEAEAILVFSIPLTFLFIAYPPFLFFLFSWTHLSPKLPLSQQLIFPTFHKVPSPSITFPETSLLGPCTFWEWLNTLFHILYHHSWSTQYKHIWVSSSDIPSHRKLLASSLNHWIWKDIGLFMSIAHLATEEPRSLLICFM